jgi:hypothetical protein
MKRVQHCLERQVRATKLDDRIHMQEPSVLQGEPNHKTDSFERLATLGQLDEARSLSSLGAFFIYTVGMGSGVAWTLVLMWFF